MKFGRDRRRAPALVDLTALIDVVFLLLLFFVVTASFDATRSLGIDLPEAKAGSTKATQPDVYVLTMLEDASLLLDGEPIALEDLSHRLRSDSTVRLEADEDTHHGEIVRLLDVLQPLRLKALRIAVKEANPSAVKEAVSD